MDSSGGTSEKGMKKHILSIHKMDGEKFKGPILHQMDLHLKQTKIEFGQDRNAQRRNVAIWFAVRSISKVEIENPLYITAHFPGVKKLFANVEDLGQS